LLHEEIDYQNMWCWRFPKEVKFDKNNWQNICEYWNEEMYILRTDDNKPVNEFLFDSFQKMLWHQGFQDE